MKKSDFYYDLPQELIAQEPCEQRDHSRLLVVGKNSGALQHRHFYDLPDFLRPNDCLVLNNSRVLPARIYGVKKDTGAHVEFLLLKNKGNDTWECIAGPGKRAKEHSVFTFGNNDMQGEVLGVLENGNRLVHFTYSGLFLETLERIGEMPLPHYITHELKDRIREIQRFRGRANGGASFYA